MTALVSDSVAQPRFRSTLLLSFAGLAMLLAVVGTREDDQEPLAVNVHAIGPAVRAHADDVDLQT
jgi:hypothetical protein